MTRRECEHSAKDVFTCVLKLHYRREHAAYGGYPHHPLARELPPREALVVIASASTPILFILNLRLRQIIFRIAKARLI